MIVRRYDSTERPTCAIRFWLSSCTTSVTCRDILWYSDRGDQHARRQRRDRKIDKDHRPGCWRRQRAFSSRSSFFYPLCLPTPVCRAVPRRGNTEFFLKYVTEIVLLRVADLFRDDIRLVVSCHQKLDRAPQPDIGQIGDVRLSRLLLKHR